MRTIEEYTNPWEYMSDRWNLFVPPSRPSRSDIQNFRALLHNCIHNNKMHNCKVLLLGSTPEIRDMLAAYKNVNVTLVDLTIDMILAMTKLMANKASETWVICDWLDAPLTTNYFDAIIGDLVMCNISPEKHDEFMAKIKSLLKRNGHWINRVCCIDENTKIRNLEELFEEYSQKKPITKEDVNNFRHMAGLNHWDPHTKILLWSKLLDDMNRYHVDGEYRHPNTNVAELLNRLYELYEPFHKMHWYGTKEETDILFSGYFKIQEVIKDIFFDSLHEKGYYTYDLVKESV